MHIDDDTCDHELFYEALGQISDALAYIAIPDAKEALDKLVAGELIGVEYHQKSNAHTPRHCI